ncbi:MAG: hypothetical protein A2Y57_01990 [Candidatus Woykebacteria bacterium RBG_13_40_7b]|uniref:Uncharacterized protein n=1 Tax=Candidatus Woykebacteria bacterium RBG_13_40_7b TaxID=1802594 RepID=A0A1G1WA86_9BACT|nr:MAG: hypothetical protein A2Y57_01990 [Candidatus Woykebacteria bacterium RBG_13_40_7b]
MEDFTQEAVEVGQPKSILFAQLLVLAFSLTILFFGEALFQPISPFRKLLIPFVWLILPFTTQFWVWLGIYRVNKAKTKKKAIRRSLTFLIVTTILAFVWTGWFCLGLCSVFSELSYIEQISRGVEQFSLILVFFIPLFYWTRKAD